MGQEVIHPPIVVTDRAYPYLRIQKGGIPAELARGAWEERYRQSLADDFAGIRPYLPERCNLVIDIGGGMGGIDILIARHYPSRWGPLVRILDGVADKPVMSLHRETFSNTIAAEQFLRTNGVSRRTFLSPMSAKTEATPAKADLIISLGAWCFHLPPEEYMSYVMKACQPGTVLILDVRKDKPEWRAAIGEPFPRRAVILDRPKFERVVFHAG